MSNSRSDGSSKSIQPMHFTEAEVQWIESLFRDYYMFGNCEILTFIGEQYNEQLSLNSRVYLLNIDIDHSRTSMIRLMGVLNLVFNRIIEEIHVVPCNCWVRVFFERFPSREFSSSTVLVGDINTEMFLETLSRNIQSNDSIELNGGWETNVVISYVPHRRQSDVSVLNRNGNRVVCVTLNKRVSGSGKRLPVKYDCQLQYGVYKVEPDCQPYTDCCFLLSILNI